jgi:large subunit ribosomal protein L16
MLQPIRTKYRKHHRGKRGGLAVTGSTLEFGNYGLRALTPGWLTSRQIEACRRTIVHHLERGGQIWIRIYPDKSATSRPLETRMGGGKGAVDHWVAVVRRGRMLFELSGVPDQIARDALRLAQYKLPIKTAIIKRDALI